MLEVEPLPMCREDFEAPTLAGRSRAEKPIHACCALDLSLRAWALFGFERLLVSKGRGIGHGL